MFIKVETFTLNLTDFSNLLDQILYFFSANLDEGVVPLRWAIIDVDENQLTIEAIITDAAPARESDSLHSSSTSTVAQPWADFNRRYGGGKPFTIVHVVPTGIGATIGGFAGDASPATSVIAEVADRVITHPNVLNSWDFYGGRDNVLYVEGYILDSFLMGKTILKPVRSNAVGVVIDKTDDGAVNEVLNVINAVRTVYGISILGYCVTEHPIRGRVIESRKGGFTGVIENPEALIKASQRLINKGAKALAITSNLVDVPPAALEKHFEGKGPNPMGGVEAVISHLVSYYFSCPAAHAPMFGIKLPQYKSRVVDPRAAGEWVSLTGLPCVLLGLSKTPRPINKASAFDTQSTAVTKPMDSIRGSMGEVISVDDVSAVVMPSSSLGGIPALVAEKRNIPLIAVEENETVLSIRSEDLRLKNVIQTSNYLEATGVLAAIKAGINWRTARRPVMGLEEI
jgi:hypothetical protein